MSKRSVISAGALLLATSLTLSACGTRGGDSDGGSFDLDAGDGEGAIIGIVIIAVVALLGADGRIATGDPARW